MDNKVPGLDWMVLSLARKDNNAMMSGYPVDHMCVGDNNQEQDAHTSFVFQRCLWVGKWSARGRLSKLSGNFMGSPSAEERRRGHKQVRVAHME